MFSSQPEGKPTTTIKRKASALHSSSSSSSSYSSSSSSSSSQVKTTLSNSAISSSREILYRKEEDTEGKKLSKTQIKKNLVDDDNNVQFFNQTLSNAHIVAYVSNILITMGNMDPNVVKELLDAESVDLFRIAFTHWSVKGERNYELFETLGDTTFNKIVSFYIVRRFRELEHDLDANYKVTEASKLYKGRTVADKFADKLQLPQMARWRNVKYNAGLNAVKQVEMDNKFKTDLFESFIAAIELIIDKKVYPHAGYSIVYNILEVLLDDLDMTIDLRKTKPATAQLKELLDRSRSTRQFQPIKDDTNDIIGMKVYLSFPQPEGLISLKTKQSVFEKHFSVMVHGKDVGEEHVSLLALQWMQEEFGLHW